MAVCVGCPERCVLQITYIGYVSQECESFGKKELNVVLKEDTETLDEVVVVGFGTQKKVNLNRSCRTCYC